MRLKWIILDLLDWLAGWIKVLVFFAVLILLYALAQVMANGDLFTFEIEKRGDAWISTNGAEWHAWTNEIGANGQPVHNPIIVGWEESSNSVFLLAGTNVKFRVTETFYTNDYLLLTFSSNSWMYLGPSVSNPMDNKSPPMPP